MGVVLPFRFMLFWNAVTNPSTYMGVLEAKSCPQKFKKAGLREKFFRANQFFVLFRFFAKRGGKKHDPKCPYK